MMTSTDVSELTQKDVDLYKNFVRIHFRRKNYGIRYLALQCGTIYSLKNKKLANEVHVC